MENLNKVFKYNGTIEGYYPIFLKNLLFNILTLGIYSSWAATNNRRYFLANIEFSDSNYEYHGTGMELFVGRIKALGLIILWTIVFLVYTFLFENISEMMVVLGAIIFTLGFFALIPIAIVGALKYRLSRTSWKEIRHNFVGDYREFAPIFLQGLLISILTLGIYFPFFVVSIWRYAIYNSRMGNKEFSFKGTGSKYFIIVIKGIFLIPLTLGIYTFWYLAEVYNYVINNIELDGKKFSSKISGGDVFILVFPNILILAFTIGLGWPIVISRIIWFFADKITLDESFDAKSIEAGPVDMETATGEGLGVLLDLDL